MTKVKVKKWRAKPKKPPAAPAPVRSDIITLDGINRRINLARSAIVFANYCDAMNDDECGGRAPQIGLSVGYATQIANKALDEIHGLVKELHVRVLP